MSEHVTNGKSKHITNGKSKHVTKGKSSTSKPQNKPQNKPAMAVKGYKCPNKILSVSAVLKALSEHFESTESLSLEDVEKALCIADVVDERVPTEEAMRDLLSELCVKCGWFAQAHLGVCDDCRWYCNPLQSSERG